MSYQPNEAATLAALQSRAKRRDNEYTNLMEMTVGGIRAAADHSGVPWKGRTLHDIACEVVDARFPEIGAAQSDVFSDPNKFQDTVFAQAATAEDQQRYAYMTAGQPVEEPGDTWPIDVPERQAGVGYKRADGTICPLDSEGSVLLSGWGPEKVRFLLVSLAPFFEVDYVKEFVLALSVAAHKGQYNLMYELVQNFLHDQQWTEDAEQAILSELPVAGEPSGEPIYDQAAQQTGGWLTANGDQADTPTEVIELKGPIENKPMPY